MFQPAALLALSLALAPAAVNVGSVSTPSERSLATVSAEWWATTALGVANRYCPPSKPWPPSHQAVGAECAAVFARLHALSGSTAMTSAANQSIAALRTIAVDQLNATHTVRSPIPPVQHQLTHAEGAEVTSQQLHHNCMRGSVPTGLGKNSGRTLGFTQAKRAPRVVL